LVSEMPSGPGIISEPEIEKIISSLSSSTMTVLLTSKVTAEEIIKQYDYCKPFALQLVDELGKNESVRLRELLPDVELIQVIHVLNESSIQQAKKIEKYVDKILLDSGNPNRNVKTLGGTGNTHNWEISKKLVEEVNVPVFLAGGLNYDNVIEAVKKVNPFGIDLCSGVRTNGKLDRLKLNDFFNIVRNAD
ncbi:MAG: phosphoribosylanthranilate isomerase, partial [Melioribacteraceae bacterium]|nr:phosphoribosylanthranilate isomerase [Melioribacteraceae bacterium]